MESYFGSVLIGASPDATRLGLAVACREHMGRWMPLMIMLISFSAPSREQIKECQLLGLQLTNTVF